jgi:5-(carboxyamino)imidazole ribonucleotide synthase
VTPTIGILGAGQLGRMLALSGYPLGVKFVFVDPAPSPPAADLAPHLQLAYDDPKALQALSQCDSVTYEFENVPEATARALSGSVSVFPAPEALHVAQDRWLEKQCFAELGIPTPRSVAVDTLTEFDAAVREIGPHAVAKTRRMGYDGKGQRLIRSTRDAASAWAALGGVPLILEELVPFERELSLIAVRSSTGQIACYPLAQNEHHDGILRVTLAPAPRLTPALQLEAERYGALLLERFQYVGVLALELFQIDGRLLANEIAPRVHNSGHWTIEGAVTSQFENHLRAGLGLPLGATQATCAAGMINLIGQIPDPATILELPGAHLHLYGKTPRAGRKLGHVTLCARTAEERQQRVARLRALCDPSP